MTILLIFGILLFTYGSNAVSSASFATSSSITSKSTLSTTSTINLPTQPQCSGDKKIRVIFLVKNFYFSALWNAYDISNYFSQHRDIYPDIETSVFLDIKQFNKLKRTEIIAKGKADLCVFLKSDEPDPAAFKKCKMMGAKSATLLDDVIPSTFLRIEDTVDLSWIAKFDYVIAVNSFTRAKIQEYFDLRPRARSPKVWVIPVHHTNYHQGN